MDRSGQCRWLNWPHNSGQQDNPCTLAWWSSPGEKSHGKPCHYGQLDIINSCWQWKSLQLPRYSGQLHISHNTWAELNLTYRQHIISRQQIRLHWNVNVQCWSLASWQKVKFINVIELEIFAVSLQNIVEWNQQGYHLNTSTAPVCNNKTSRNLSSEAQQCRFMKQNKQGHASHCRGFKIEIQFFKYVLSRNKKLWDRWFPNCNDNIRTLVWLF